MTDKAAAASDARRLTLISEGRKRPTRGARALDEHRHTLDGPAGVSNDLLRGLGTQAIEGLQNLRGHFEAHLEFLLDHAVRAQPVEFGDLFDRALRLEPDAPHAGVYVGVNIDRGACGLRPLREFAREVERGDRRHESAFGIDRTRIGGVMVEGLRFCR